MTALRTGTAFLEEMEAILDKPTQDQIDKDFTPEGFQEALEQPSQEIIDLRDRALSIEAELIARTDPAFSEPATATLPERRTRVRAAGLQIGLDPFRRDVRMDFELPVVGLDLLNRERGRRGLEPLDALPGPADLGEFLVDDLLTEKGVRTRTPFLGGFAEGKDLWNVYLAGLRAEQGLAQPDDWRLILDYQEALLMQQRGKTFPADVASLLSDSIPFMAEFLVSGGLINMGRTLAMGGVRKMVKRKVKDLLADMTIKKGVTASLRRAAGKVGDLTVMSAARLPFFYGELKANTIHRLIPEMSTGLDDDGALSFVVVAPGEEIGDAIKNAGIDTFVGIWTEGTGGVLNKPVAFIGRKARNRAEKIIGSKLPTLKIGASSILGRAGYSTIPGELFEEELNKQILDGLTRYDIANSPQEPTTLRDVAVQTVGFSFIPLGTAALGGATRKPVKAAKEVASKIGEAAKPAREAREKAEEVKQRLLSPDGAAEITSIAPKEAKAIADKEQPSRADFDKLAEKLPDLQGLKLDKTERAEASEFLRAEAIRRKADKAADSGAPEPVVLDPKNVPDTPLPETAAKGAAKTPREWLRRFVAANPEIRQRPWFTVKGGKLVFEGQSTTTVEPDFFGDIGELVEGQRIIVDVDKFSSKEKPSPDKQKPARARVGLKDAQDAVLEIGELNSAFLGKEETFPFAGLTFKAGDPAVPGRKRQIETLVADIKERLPRHLKGKVKIVNPGDSEFFGADGESLFTEINDESKAAEIIIGANKSESPESRAVQIANSIIDNFEMFSPEDVMAAKNLIAISGHLEVEQIKAGDLDVGDTLEIVGEKHTVVSDDGGIIVLKDDITLAVPEDTKIAVDKGSIEKSEGEDSFAFGANVERGGPTPQEPMDIADLPQPPSKRLISAAEIVATISKRFKVPIRTGRIRGKHAAIFKVNDELIRVKGQFWGDLGLMTDELGHLISKRFDVVRNAPPEALAELKGLDYNEKRRDPEEGFGQFVSMYQTEDGAAESAPVFSAYFDQVLAQNPELQIDFSAIKNLIDQYRAQGAQGRGKASMLRSNKPVRPLGVPLISHAADTLERAWDLAYASMKNEAHFHNKMVREAKRRGLKRQLGETSIELRMALSQAGPVHAQTAIENGVHTIGENPQIIGPSMVEALEGLHGDREFTDNSLFMRASHSQEVWAINKNPGMGRKEADQIVEELETPERVASHETTTQFNNSLIEMLQDADVISEQSRDNILNEYERYVPLLRVMMQTGAGGRFASQGRRLDTTDPVKRRRGSGLPVIDPVYATFQNAIRFYDSAAKHIVMNKMIREAREVGGMGYWITKVPANLQKISLAIEEVQTQLQELGVAEDAFADIDPADLLAIYRPIRELNGKPIFRHRMGRTTLREFADLKEQGLAGQPLPDPTSEEGAALQQAYEASPETQDTGKTELYEMNPNLVRSMDGMSPIEWGWIMETFGRFTRLLKLGAIGTNPTWAAKNFLRDQLTYHAQRQYAQGAGAFLTPVEMIGTYIYSQGAKLAGKKGDPFVELWDQWGGQLSKILGMDVDNNQIRRSVERALRSTATSKSLGIVRHPIDAFREFVTVTEVGPRLAEFAAVLESFGWTRSRIRKEGSPPRHVIVAGINAANDVTVNFKRMGTFGRQINQIIPFFNASLEGADKFVRTFKDDPTRAMAVAMIGSASTVGYWMTVQDEDWYKTEPDWLKYGFWRIGKDVRVPVPFEWGWIVKAGTEAILNAIVAQGGMQEIKNYLKLAPFAVAPPFQPSFITPLFESFMNYSLHRRRPIIPRGTEPYEPKDQYSPYNTHTMRAIGEFLGMSPALLEHAVDGFTGRLFSRAVKPIERWVTGEEVNRADRLVKGGFLLRKQFSKDVDQIYKDSKAVGRRLKSATKRDDDTLAMKAEDKRLREAKSMLAELGELNEGIIASDVRFENAEKYQIGLARHVLGLSALDSFPNPLTDPNPSEEVEAIRAKYLGRKLMAMSDNPKVESDREGVQEARNFAIKFAKQEIEKLGIPIEQIIYRNPQTDQLESPLLEREWDRLGKRRTKALSRRRVELARLYGVK